MIIIRRLLFVAERDGLSCQLSKAVLMGISPVSVKTVNGSTYLTGKDYLEEQPLSISLSLSLALIFSENPSDRRQFAPLPHSYVNGKSNYQSFTARIVVVSEPLACRAGGFCCLR